MRMVFTTVVALVLMALGANAQSSTRIDGQTALGANAPTAEQIVEQNLSATKINTIQTIVLKGEVAEYGRTSAISIECRSDSKVLLRTTNKMGATAICLNGGGGWLQNDMAGGSKRYNLTKNIGMPEYAARNISRDMGLMPRPDKAETVVLSGQYMLNGVPTYVLLTTYGANDERVLYIRQDNFLLMREIRKEPNQANLDVIIDYSDYQITDGVTLPTTIRKTVAKNIVSTCYIRSTEINVPLADTMFAP